MARGWTKYKQKSYSVNYVYILLYFYNSLYDNFAQDHGSCIQRRESPTSRACDECSYHNSLRTSLIEGFARNWCNVLSVITQSKDLTPC